MQLSFSFRLLLATLCLTVPSQAIPSNELSSSLLSMPLSRISGSRSDIHPLMGLQQRINRSAMRLARMTGRTLSRDELERSMHKRILSVEGLEGLHRRCSEAGGSVTGDICTDAFNRPADLHVDEIVGGYTVTLQMGTPARDFVLLLDSGSGDLWVGGENCRSLRGDCGKHTFLGSKSSSSFVSTNTTFVLSYGSGAVAGNISHDDVTVAGLTLKGHTFGVATNESPDLVNATYSPFDGILGLGKSILSAEKVPTIVDALASAGFISSPIVSYKLSRPSDGLDDGEVSFGGLDYTKFNALTLVKVPNTNKLGYWEAALGKITVNGVDTGIASRTGIMDTGTSLLQVSPADAQIIHNLIKGTKPDGHGGFTVPSTLQDKLALTIGGQAFSIDPRDLAVTPVNANDPQGDCTSGVSSSTGIPANTWVAGDVFLKNVYFSTNVEDDTLSFAKLL